MIARLSNLACASGAWLRDRHPPGRLADALGWLTIAALMALALIIGG